VLLRPRLHAALFFLLLSTAACGGDSAAAPAAPSPTPTPGPAGWTLVFADEFDAPGALDPAKWGYEIGYIRNDEKQSYTSRSENVRAEGGNLVIEARKEAYQGYGYTSASINTFGRFEFLYGRVEVRATIPTGTGSWPAIWMLGTNITQVGWPACGEIDIMEFVGFLPGVIHANVHMQKYNHTKGTGKGDKLVIKDATEGFHVYAMEWYPDRLDFFVDQTRYFTFKNENPPDQRNADSWPFDRPQYLILNLAIGGAWGAQKGIDESIFPARFLIDYVRVYRKK
jgi:beta-glucanase (GH16 family)